MFHIVPRHCLGGPDQVAPKLRRSPPRSSAAAGGGPGTLAEQLNQFHKAKSDLKCIAYCDVDENRLADILKQVHDKGQEAKGMAIFATC